MATASPIQTTGLYSVNMVDDGYKLSYKLEHCSQYQTKSISSIYSING